jgi:hypothetical protein
MTTTLIVELEVLSDAVSRIAYRVICTQIDFFVLDRFPQSLDEDIVSPAAFAVHAHADAAIPERLRKLGAGEPAALVGVEDLGRAVASEGFLQGVNCRNRCSC